MLMMYTKMCHSLHVLSVHYCFAILMKTGVYQQIAQNFVI